MEQEKSQINIAVLMTCFNRKQQTIECIRSLLNNGTEYHYSFVITDAASTDGTSDAIRAMNEDTIILNGTSNLFWNGGMVHTLDYALKNCEHYDYVMLVNDDVTFYPNMMQPLLTRLQQTDADVIVGATRDHQGKTSYGGVKMLSRHFARFALQDPTEEVLECDTFNCNCILMGRDTFIKAGNLDPAYVHSMGDYDYGMSIHKLGLRIISSSDYVGVCDDNDNANTWRDCTLTRRERLKKKEGPKGLPRKDWYHFVRKNYGFFPAIYHSATPYIRILLKK
ncbi:MAG TPA: glycosyltransferase family 2 protein [Lachnospiraceae bacterium]|nr:glycosyltransferase family 2 protein [Lachnospiraceae bacterium]